MDQKRRDSYLKKKFGISFETWDFICRFYGNHCLYPGCKFVGDAFSLSVDHVYPKHMGGGDNIRNYQPLCKHHNLYVKNGKYKDCDYRVDSGKDMIKSLKNHQGNSSYQLSLMFPVASLDLTNIDKPQIQPDFFYLLHDYRKREVWELRDFVKDVLDQENWYGGYVDRNAIEVAYKRIDRILKRQETFYVSPLTGEPIGIKRELNNLIRKADIHPLYYDLQILYDETNVYWAEKFNEINQCDFTPREIYFANSDWYSFYLLEFKIEKLKSIDMLDHQEIHKAWNFATLLRCKIQDWKTRINNKNYCLGCHFLKYMTYEICWSIIQYYKGA